MNYSETKAYMKQIFGEEITKEQVPQKIEAAVAQIKEAEGLDKEVKEAAVETLSGIQKAIRFGAQNNKPSKVLQRRATEAFKHMANILSDKEGEEENAMLFKGLSQGSFEESTGRRKW